jgi:hypothetical protein
MPKKKLPMLKKASQAWRVIAFEAEQKRSGCTSSGGFTGLCIKVEDLYMKGRISEDLQYRMERQLREVFYEDARDAYCEETGLLYGPAYGWECSKEGWEQRVMAAQLLSILSREQEQEGAENGPLFG